MAKIRHIFRLYALYLKMDLAWLFRDRTFAILAILTDLISNLSSVMGVFLLAWRFDGIGGMGRFEVLFMLGYATIINGIYISFGAFNTANISRRIGRGQFEHMFIQPVSLPVQLVTGGFFPITGGSNIISGAAVMVVATTNIGIALPGVWWWVLSLVVNIFISFAILMGVSYLASSLAFYAPVQAEEISSYVIDSFSHISTFPLSGMSAGLQASLITLIPVGLLAWFPTLVLFGNAPFNLPALYPLLFAVVLWIIATYFFKKGLNFYVKKGINRYHPMGHRR